MQRLHFCTFPSSSSIVNNSSSCTSGTGLPTDINNRLYPLCTVDIITNPHINEQQQQQQQFEQINLWSSHSSNNINNNSPDTNNSTS